MKLRGTRVTLVGLGLMGGSLAHGLKGRCAGLIGVDRDPAVVERARSLRIVDRATTDLASALADCDLALLAVPVRSILSLLHRLGRDLPLPPCVLDVGSTKVAVVQAMQALPEGADPIGGHPLCGKETSGLEAASPGLFQGSTFVLTPLERTSPAARSLAEEMVRALGAQPLIMEAARHDRLVAFTSHLPYLLAAGLIETAREAAGQEPELWSLTASGFRDTSRLAASDVSMMLDILLTNRDNVGAALGRARAALERLEDLLTAGDEEGLRLALRRLREARASGPGGS